MRHGLTMGELARWFVQTLRLDVELASGADGSWSGDGWPRGERVWINPSPNAPNVAMARCYPGTVMLEGTTLSEGAGRRGRWNCSVRRRSTRARSSARCGALRRTGCAAASCASAGSSRFPQACGQALRRTAVPRRGATLRGGSLPPWRWVALAFKALRKLKPDYALCANLRMNTSGDRLAIDLINGGELLRRWVDDAQAASGDLDAQAAPDEQSWRADASVSHLS